MSSTKAAANGEAATKADENDLPKTSKTAKKNTKQDKASREEEAVAPAPKLPELSAEERAEKRKVKLPGTFESDRVDEG